jgi:hypothetical protein
LRLQRLAEERQGLEALALIRRNHGSMFSNAGADQRCFCSEVRQRVTFPVRWPMSAMDSR